MASRHRRALSSDSIRSDSSWTSGGPSNSSSGSRAASPRSRAIIRAGYAQNSSLQKAITESVFLFHSWESINQGLANYASQSQGKTSLVVHAPEEYLSIPLVVPNHTERLHYRSTHPLDWLQIQLPIQRMEQITIETPKGIHAAILEEEFGQLLASGRFSRFSAKYVVLLTPVSESMLIKLIQETCRGAEKLRLVPAPGNDIRGVIRTFATPNQSRLWLAPALKEVVLDAKKLSAAELGELRATATTSVNARRILNRPLKISIMA